MGRFGTAYNLEPLTVELFWDQKTVKSEPNTCFSNCALPPSRTLKHVFLALVVAVSGYPGLRPRNRWNGPKMHRYMPQDQEWYTLNHTQPEVTGNGTKDQNWS